MRITLSVVSRCSFITAVCLVSMATCLRAQTFDQLGERAQGMGGAFVAVADDASAIYWNPAGLANVFKFDAQLGFDAPAPSREVFLGAAMPALGAAYYR